MIENILHYLESQNYIELVLWVQEFLKQNENLISGQLRDFLFSLKNKNFPQALELIRRLSYTNIENKEFQRILAYFEEKSQDIQLQWNFEEKFSNDKKKVNLIFNKDIVIFQERIKKDKNLKNSISQIETWEDLKNVCFKPDILINEGTLYQSIGLSSIEAIYGVLKESKIQEELEKYQKYEKVAKFIENLEYPLQSLFSINQIGIIIYNNKIYLIKWVQFLNENQLLGEKVEKSSNVTVLEDLGVKIGVELKENLELGDLVIFKNPDSSKSGKEVLKPLLSLEQSLFAAPRRVQDYQSLDFSKIDDCQLFINDVLGRIESGILLLNRNKLTSVKNTRDMDIYIKVSMEKIVNLKSTNQKISILRDLLSINTNPDNLVEIIQKLEENYLIYIKELFALEQVTQLPFVLKSIKLLNLFEKTSDFLVKTVVYLFDSYAVPSKIILQCVEYVQNSWNLSPELYQLLENPQIIAITNIVIAMIQKGKFTEVMAYLSEYLEKHPQFRSQSVINLLIRILLDLFNQNHHADVHSISNKGYIRFFSNVVQVLNEYISKEKSNNPETIKYVKDNILGLSKNLDFITFINDEIIEYITLVNSLDQLYINPRNFYQIISNLCYTVPLICFHNKIHQIAKKTFEYLTQYYKNSEMTLEYINEFIKLLQQVYQNYSQSTEFMEEIIQIVLQFKEWINREDLHTVILKPLKKEMISLFNSWYLERKLPFLSYELHVKMIQEWIKFVDMESNLEGFLNLLTIKDFIWECEKFNIQNVRKKYHFLPVQLFLSNAETLYLEISSFLNKKPHDFNEFRIHNFLFDIIQKDYPKFQLTPQKFKILLKKYIENLQDLLERSILGGYSVTFKEILAEIFENLIFLPKSFYEKVFQKFVVIYESNIEEGKRFNSRLEMMQSISLTFEELLSRYDNICKVKNKILKMVPNPISFKDIQFYVEKLKKGALDIFSRLQVWLTQICATEYIQSLEKLEPVKIIFINILEQFKNEQDFVLKEMLSLGDEIFSNQKMLIDNKKKFFKMMIEIIPKSSDQKLNKKLKEKLNYIKELSDIESLYYTIKTIDPPKIETVQKRLKKLMTKYSKLFSPWFIYGNTFALMEDYPNAIYYYTEALKFESNQSNFTRLYHNLIVSYLSQENVDEAVKIIENLEIGIKTDALIVKLIRKVEEISGKKLLSQI